MIIGIDLGTTNSAAAYMGQDGPKLIPNAVGEFLTPSVVGIDTTGKLLVGRAARDYQVLEPTRCTSLFKRYMGMEKLTRIGSQTFSPEQLSSMVLTSLKHDAEAFFGTKIHEAVITVPAYFNDNQRKATIAAGQIAGFDVKRILNEPTSAALAYGMHDGRGDRVLMIFDLGGGTFDVSIVEVFDGALEVKASSGECFLGGEDFTTCIASNLLKQKSMSIEQAELKHPRMVSRLMQQCELAKRKLSQEFQVAVRMPNIEGDFDEGNDSIAVTVDDFDAWTDRILQRIDSPIRRALGDARLTRDDIDQILLVGGATRMRAVVDRIQKIFAKKPQSHLNPDEVVALGAAVQASLFSGDAIVNDLVVTDVCPFTLGISINKTIGDQPMSGYFMPIINRNTTIPVSRVDRVSTMRPNQRAIEIQVYQGESRMVKDNLQIGRFEVTDIPLGPAGQEIDIRFTYDLNGILEIEATIVTTGKKVSHVITQYSKSLSPAQIRSAITQMQSLKIHPRDEAANDAVMKRAERLFKELPPHARNQLGQLIEGFEGAMELQEKHAIAEFRELLDRTLDILENDGDSEIDSYNPW
ncbi:MAG: Hsp70 family protein [Planctomycetota bacterium]|nr:Hsp70 family protein [Planctomycetota bacterium]